MYADKVKILAFCSVLSTSISQRGNINPVMLMYIIREIFHEALGLIRKAVAWSPKVFYTIHIIYIVFIYIV